MPDIEVQNEGTIYLFQPLTEKAREWIGKHIHNEAREVCNRIRHEGKHH